MQPFLDPFLVKKEPPHQGGVNSASLPAAQTLRCPGPHLYRRVGISVIRPVPFALFPDSAPFIPFIFKLSYYLSTLAFTLVSISKWTLQPTTFILKLSFTLLDGITFIVKKKKANMFCVCVCVYMHACVCLHTCN